MTVLHPSHTHQMPRLATTASRGASERRNGIQTPPEAENACGGTLGGFLMAPAKAAQRWRLASQVCQKCGRRRPLAGFSRMGQSGRRAQTCRLCCSKRQRGKRGDSINDDRVSLDPEQIAHRQSCLLKAAARIWAALAINEDEARQRTQAIIDYHKAVLSQMVEQHIRGKKNPNSAEANQ